MHNRANAHEELPGLLREFHALAAAVWEKYLDVGPGRVEAGLFEGGETVAEDILELLAGGKRPGESATPVDAEELREAVETVCDLAHRCATRPEGLCFITGEAGLVPRRDWHAAMEKGLGTLSEAVG